MRQAAAITVAALLWSVLLLYCTLPPAPGSGAAPAPASPARVAVPGAVALDAGHTVSVGCLTNDCDDGDIVIQPDPGGTLVFMGCHHNGPLDGPPTGTECDIYYDLTLHLPCYHNGTGWICG